MNTKSILSGGSSGPLSPYINHYLTQIRAEGYAARSIDDQVCALNLFGRWLKRTGREVRDLTEAVTCDFLQRVIKGRYPKDAAPAALRRLLEMLRQIGATPAAKAARPSPSERLTCAYERFLFKERALSQETVTGHRCFVRKFLSEKFGSGPPNLSKLRPLDVTAFVQRHAHQHGPAQARNLVGAMRSFLRYLHYRGLVHRDLSLVVPKVACWSFSVGPKHLAPAQVRQVLHHCDRSTAVGRRDYAILLLLARLGLRAGEVVRLNLEDIDWENARITVCGKGGKWAQLPLPADVARAIARYLRHDRPRCASRRVFLRNKAPIDGFKSGRAISSIVKAALAKAGVVSARKGAHLLRHSLAMDMLRRGASFDEIGEVLRHKCSKSTSIYAKVDLQSLRTLTLPWPGGVR
jgi:site-specific recombinase XerD